MGTVPVISGETACAELLAAENFSYALAPGERPEIVLSKPGFVYAPVEEGKSAGFAYVMVDDQPVGKIPLVYGSTVEQAKTYKRSFIDKLLGKDR